jgi:hypothetical protein
LITPLFDWLSLVWISDDLKFRDDFTTIASGYFLSSAAISVEASFNFAILVGGLFGSMPEFHNRTTTDYANFDNYTVFS